MGVEQKGGRVRMAHYFTDGSIKPGPDFFSDLMHASLLNSIHFVRLADARADGYWKENKTFEKKSSLKVVKR